MSDKPANKLKRIGLRIFRHAGLYENSFKNYTNPFNTTITKNYYFPSLSFS